MSKKINFRHRARQHFQAASELMKTEDDSLLLLAALELRMTIECFAYELLQSHQDDIDNSTMETWQPGRLIRELKEIDSTIECDRSISVGIEKVPGEEAKEMQSLGTDVRLTASWINKHWNTLGGYLHEPTIMQHREGKFFNATNARTKMVDILGEIDRVLASTLFATNFTLNVTKSCDCGFKIQRREEFLKRDGQVVCANCKTIWGVEKIEKGWRFKKLLHEFLCPKCEAQNKFPARELSEKSEFTCKECGIEIVLMKDWCVSVKSDL